VLNIPFGQILLFQRKSKQLDDTVLKTDLQRAIEDSLEKDKAEDICVINLAGKSTIAEHMIIATGRSKRHVTSIADRLAERLKISGIFPIGIEGKEEADWILLDLGDVIVQVFRQEVREFYDLEKMWAAIMPETATT